MILQAEIPRTIRTDTRHAKWLVEILQVNIGFRQGAIKRSLVQFPKAFTRVTCLSPTEEPRLFPLWERQETEDRQADFKRQIPVVICFEQLTDEPGGPSFLT